MFSYEEIRDRASTGITDILFSPKPYFNTIIRKHDTRNKEFHRIAVLDKHTNDSEVRNLLIAISYLKLIGAKLRISYNVKANAILIYRKALKKDLIRGRSIEAIVCASLYFACRMFKIPIAFKEIIDLYDKLELNILQESHESSTIKLHGMEELLQGLKLRGEKWEDYFHI